MNELRCSEIEELLAGYAAHALDNDEGFAVATHLAECRNHDSELAAIRVDFERLTLAVVEPVEPSTGLRASLLDAFDQELRGNSAPAVGVQAVPVVEPRIASGGANERRWFTVASFGYALAAGLLVLAVGLGAWGLSRSGGDDVVIATTTQAGNTMQVTYIQDRHLAVLDVELAAPPEGQTYQAWQIVGGQAVSIGVLTTHSGQIAFSADLEKASALALSVEPAGGSVSPTTAPILVADLPES